MKKSIKARRKTSVSFSVVMVLFAFFGFINSAEAWDPRVDTIWTIKENGGRVDWSHSGNNLIAFDKPDSGDYYDVFTMNPDGSNEVCLTCSNPQLPGKHMGNPAWHPSGDYIVFQAEKSSHPAVPPYFTTPGVGIYNDLWVMTSDGDSVWQLTDLDTTERTGVLHPHFSHDGSKLLWSENLDASQMALKIADFVVDSSGPHLDSITIYQPGSQHRLYESHGFLPGDTIMLFTGSLQPGQHWTGMDIYTLNLNSLELRRLTSTWDDWDEHAQYSPNGDTIIWISSNGYPFNPDSFYKELRTELWMMNADSSDKVRLTYFNKPGHPEYTGVRTVVGDNSWSPEGSKIAAKIQLCHSTDSVEYRIVMIELAEPSVEEEKIGHPEGFYLFQNYPNPFTKMTDIKFQAPNSKSQVTMKIYDVSGRIVKSFNLTSCFLPLASGMIRVKSYLQEFISVS
jgi:Tol biopolymer transport system component